MKKLVWFLIVQLIIFVLAAFFVIIYRLKLKLNKEEFASPFEKLTILTKESQIKEVISLKDQQSLFLGKKENEELVFENFEDESRKLFEYAVLNLVSGDWYIEVVTRKYPMGLKKSGDNSIYKLKPLVPYKLSKNDILYLDSYKLIVE